MKLFYFKYVFFFFGELESNVSTYNKVLFLIMFVCATVCTVDAERRDSLPGWANLRYELFQIGSGLVVLV